MKERIEILHAMPPKRPYKNEIFDRRLKSWQWNLQPLRR